MTSDSDTREFLAGPYPPEETQRKRPMLSKRLSEITKQHPNRLGEAVALSLLVRLA